MYIDKNGHIYINDCAQGDREATPSEISAWQALREKDAIRSEISQALAAQGLSMKWQVASAAAGVLALAKAEGLTEQEAYEQRPGYRDAKDLLALIEAKEALL